MTPEQPSPGRDYDTPEKHHNRLIHEKSPYLLQHAENPVDWYPWGPEAFDRAARENKPVFLSIGYSTCHWCHVMAHESFEEGILVPAQSLHTLDRNAGAVLHTPDGGMKYPEYTRYVIPAPDEEQP
jgi:hypothetical protein